MEGHSSSLPYVYYLDWFSIHFDFPPRDCFVRSCSRVTAIKLLSCVDIHREISAVSLEERGEEKSTPNYHYHHIEEKEGDMPFIGKGKTKCFKNNETTVDKHYPDASQIKSSLAKRGLCFVEISLSLSFSLSLSLSPSLPLTYH